MKIINSVERAVEALKNGKTIIFPTETSYGLGCDARNEKAVEKIFAIKKRIKSKPLLVVVADLAMAKKFLKWNKKIDELAKKYWMSKTWPLTIIGECAAPLPDGVVSDDGLLALRVSSHPVASELSRQLNAPVVATSANISDEGDIYNSRDLKRIFEQEKMVDFLFDGGELPRQEPSTIVKVLGDNVEVIRQGAVKL